MMQSHATHDVASTSQNSTTPQLPTTALHNVDDDRQQQQYQRQRQQQREAIYLSNHGQSLIDQCKYDEAVAVLSKSLRVCRRIMAEAPNDQVPLCTSLDACMRESKAGRRSSVTNRSSEASCHRGFGENYLYQLAISIPLNIGTNYRACVMVSTMVTFNLALANQLASAAKLTDESQDMLRKAVRLYELAFNMQQEENFDRNTLFTLATVNNLGLIHSQLNDRTAANQCFEYLLSTLMYVTDSWSAEGGHHVGEQFDGFFLNASTLIHKPESAPAA